MKRLFLILTMIICGCFFSCKKDNSSNGNNPNTTGAILANGVTKFSKPNSDGKVAIFNWTERDVTFCYYGNISNAGEITNINAVSFYRTSNKDTVYNFTLDVQNRIENFYVTIKGTKINSLAKYSYPDTTIALSLYEINWLSNTVSIKNQALITESNLVPFNNVVYRLQGVEKEIIRLATIAVVLYAGYGLITFGLATSTTGLAAVFSLLIGGYLALTGLKALANFTLDKLHLLIDLLNNVIPSADAGEVEFIPNNLNLPPSPNIECNTINKANSENPIWSWTLYYCSIQFLPGSPLLDPSASQVDFDYSSSYPYNFYVGRFTKRAAPICPLSYHKDDAINGNYFWVKPGTSTYVTTRYRTCDGSLIEKKYGPFRGK